MEKISVLLPATWRDKIFGEKYYERLRKHGEVNIYDREDFSDMDYVREFLKDSTVIITSWGSPVIDESILKVCPNLKALLHAAGSIKPVISDALIKKGVRMTASAAAIGEGVAETALALAITGCKRIYTLSRDTANGLWGENKENVKDFYDIKVGVVSAGFVGRHMIKLLHNFHVDILVYDPFLSAEQIRELGAEKRELNELLAESDVITVHAPSIPETEGMFNKDNIKLIRDGAVLVNTARGKLFDEEALIEELRKNRFFACVDVTCEEPPKADNELRKLPNVILTPHIAGTVTNGLRRIALHVCEEADRLFEGERMRTEIDPKKLATMA